MALIRWAMFKVLRIAFICVAAAVAATALLSARTQVQFQVLHSFAGNTEGASPNTLIQASDGKFYGVTTNGGPTGEGTFFTMTPGGIVTVLHTFSSASDGVSHPAGLVQAGDGNFYWASENKVFRVTLAGTVTIARTFAIGFGVFNLASAPNGNLYGTTMSGNYPSGGGSVFKMTPAGVLTTFLSWPGDAPNALTVAADGNVFVSTIPGVSTRLYNPWLWKIAPDDAVTVHHVFFVLEGSPRMLFAGPDGNPYAFAVRGGSGTGNIVRISADVGGTATIVGQRSWTDLSELRVIRARDGNFYGTTQAGGLYGAGSIVKMTLDGTIVTLHSFTSAEGVPSGNAFIQATDGKFYGTTSSGGVSGSGVAYRLSLATATAGDLDGDAKTDLTLYRPSTGVWYVKQSSTGYNSYAAYQWGLSSDVPVPGDYDGDGLDDLALYRPSSGIWYILQSSTNFTTYIAQQWGLSADIAVPGDYDGDAKNDLALYRPSTGVWYVLQSSTNYTTYLAQQWGLTTDIAVPGDYDGDAKSDLALYRPSTGVWYILQSSTSYTTYLAHQWGLTTDVAVPGDYDGDGATDLGLYRPSTGVWYIMQSSTNYMTYVTYQWGLSTDVPVPADYDGDGRTDLGLFRPSTGAWKILLSTTSYTTYVDQSWGLSTDTPITGHQ